jgi:hypothetical protein
MPANRGQSPRFPPISDTASPAHGSRATPAKSPTGDALPWKPSRPDRAFCIAKTPHSGVLLLAPRNRLICKPLCAEPLACSAKQAWNLLHDRL